MRPPALFTAALVAAVFISAGAETPEEEIRRAYLGLASDDFATREKSEALLREIGPEAALLYDPAREGKDAEVRLRMQPLLEEWSFVSLAALPQRPFPARPNPWEELKGVPREWLDSLDDDRLQEWSRREWGDEVAREYLLATGPWAPGAADIRRALARDEVETIRFVSRRRRGDLPAEMEGELAEAALRHAGGRGEAATAACVLLYRIGRGAEAAIRGVRERRLLLHKLAALADDPAFCCAVGQEYGHDASVPDEALRYPAPEFLPHYLAARDVESVARVPRPWSDEALRRLLASPEVIDAFRASVYLNARGLPTAGLGNLRACHQPKGLRVIPEFEVPFLEGMRRLGGETVEIQLRKLAEFQEDVPELCSLYLRALGVRGRRQDITFVYQHLKVLPPAERPEVAVALASLGSAAGMPFLVDLLVSPDRALAQAADDALRQIAPVDMGFDARRDLAHRCRAARRWRRWWEENKRDFKPGKKD